MTSGILPSPGAGPHWPDRAGHDHRGHAGRMCRAGRADADPGGSGAVLRFHLIREGRDKVVARGVLRARVTQTCVITPGRIRRPVEEVFQVRFVPSGEESDDIDPDADDEIPFEGNSIDLGEAAAEQLGWRWIPYPRMPGVEMPPVEEEPDDHPFAALRRLN